MLMGREEKEIELIAALLDSPLFLASSLHDSLISAFSAKFFLDPFYPAVSVDDDLISPAFFTPQETASLLRLLIGVMQVALKEPSLCEHVLRFVSVYLEVLFDSSECAAISHDLRFGCVLLYCELAVHVSKSTYVEDIIGERHYDTLYRLFTIVSRSWSDLDERNAINRVLEQMRLSI